MSEVLEKRPGGGPVRIQVTDRRPRFAGGETAAAEAVPTPERRFPTVLAELESRARTAEAKLAEALDLLRRREAEADAFRSRLRREMDRRSLARVESCVQDLLEVVDNLERGVSSAEEEADPATLREGFTKIRDQFLAALARQGVEAMRLQGTAFDPHLAEAVAVSPASEEDPDNQIVEEIRRGYLMSGRVLRPAQVRVSRRPGSGPPEAPEERSPTDS